MPPSSACGCGTSFVMKFGLRTKGAPSLASLRRKRSTSIAFETGYILRIVNRCFKAVENSLRTGAEYRSEYRAVLPNGQIRWIAGRGHVEFNGDGQPVRMRGSAVDITKRKQAEEQAACHRNEMAHLSRVTMLGELSGSIAHELNLPLSAILSNAQAAQRILANGQADLAEIREILNDIVSEDKRAGEVIRRLRLWLKKGEVQQHSLRINEVVQDVLKLIRSDLINQKVTVDTELARNLPTVTGDPVQLQQVLLNLVVNACDAMTDLQHSRSAGCSFALESRTAAAQ